jgi:hypothetical protein
MSLLIFPGVLLAGNSAESTRSLLQSIKAPKAATGAAGDGFPKAGAFAAADALSYEPPNRNGAVASGAPPPKDGLHHL